MCTGEFIYTQESIHLWQNAATAVLFIVRGELRRGENKEKERERASRVCKKAQFLTPDGIFKYKYIWKVGDALNESCGSLREVRYIYM